MNLRSSAWIPVTGDGRRATVNLEALFLRAHEFDDISVDLAPAASGLWRILTVVAARVTGLDRPDLDAAAWLQLRDDVLDDGAFDAEAVQKYFGTHEDRFGLFDAARPWMQDPRLAQQCGRLTGLNTVVFGRPAGNNQSWMSHHRDADPIPIPAQEAVLQVIAQLYHGAPGRCTSRTVATTTAADCKTAPLRGLVSYHPVGESVFESLVMSIPHLPYNPDADGEDYAFWELPDLPDPLRPPQPSAGVGGVLAGRFAHALLLVGSPDKSMVVDGYRTWGVRHPVPPARDPFLIYQVSKAGQTYARLADADRALWRDLDGLLLENCGLEKSNPPTVFANAHHVADVGVLERLRVRAFAFDQDRAQTSDRQWFTASTPPVLRRLSSPQAAAGVSAARIAAETMARRLDQALRAAWVAINDPADGGTDSVPADSTKARATRRESDIAASRWQATAAARYWPEAEREFWQQIRDNEFDRPMQRYRGLALRAFDQATDTTGNRPRTRRAIERARTLLFTTRKKKP
ncbi:type I-E CRISPR-associated protein Cse1/CasA [Nocardia sp. NPDC004654]|uniref:type I-E CRISPR-associated protein Cse1/CasA n=1 Tax=Nocardia sp. NPDC004654 TaxID=3154776 RepID=UPI0033A4F9C6